MLQRRIKTRTSTFHPSPVTAWATTIAISHLPFPEHYIRFPGQTQSAKANLARNPFPFLKLDIIGSDNMGKQRLEFIDSKESSGADKKL
jgi:hypothetical protein